MGIERADLNSQPLLRETLFLAKIVLRNLAPYEDIIGIILIRMASSALLMVAFFVYISTLNTYSTFGESQGREKRLLKIPQPELSLFLTKVSSGR